MTLAEAERLLLGRELFGMRFGLDRTRRLLTALGSPQTGLRIVEVVGSNGKSSTVRYCAALLTRQGLRTGAYLSPHLASFTERVRLDDCDVDAVDFAAAVARAEGAAQKVDRTLEDGDRVTQFELLTAAAVDCLARLGAQALVMEAGLGGRYDATNVLDAEVAVLTNVGLEHTRWLGPTITDIATEKLDVVRPGSTLVVGPGLHVDAHAVAERVCAERGARLLVAPEDPGVAVPLAARGAFQRRNLALAATAAAALAGPLDTDAVVAVARAVTVPGRLERLPGEPLTFVDGAHNAAGIAALAAALPELVGDRRLVACIGVLEDKDAAAMLAELLPLCAAVVLTRPDTPRALPPATLASLCRQSGFAGEVEIVADPLAALARVRERAGTDGVALATGSIYLVADLLTSGHRARSIL